MTLSKADTVDYNVTCLLVSSDSVDLVNFELKQVGGVDRLRYELEKRLTRVSPAAR